MRYYCNICKKDITKDEFLYSIDRFDKPLCREHQKDIRPMSPEKPVPPPIEKPMQQIEEPRPEKPQVAFKETATEKSTFGRLIKKVAVATGKGIVKGVKTMADASLKKIQNQRWKEQILRRMNYSELKSLCREKNIATTRTETEMKPDDFYGVRYKDHTTNCSFDELVDSVLLRVKLDDIISFAKRNHLKIRDIEQNMATKQAEWRIKKLSQQDEDVGKTVLTEIEKAIWEFNPLRKYWEEILYEDTLATHLKTKFHDRNVEIERQRGSSRPDIIVDGVAIEVKGPTTKSGLVSVADKCMRYKIHYPKGLIIVLFNVDVNDVNDYYYKEWLEGLKRTHPGVIVIRK